MPITASSDVQGEDNNFGIGTEFVGIRVFKLTEVSTTQKA